MPKLFDACKDRAGMVNPVVRARDCGVHRMSKNKDRDAELDVQIRKSFKALVLDKRRAADQTTSDVIARFRRSIAQSSPICDVRLRPR